ncbi:MAG: hypothetical protein MK102_17665 [Fuerstiella sp.]|nr:hypothetical protein [Fuerstiella sp.]
MISPFHILSLLATTVSTFVVAGDEACFPTKLTWGEIVTTVKTVELRITSVPDDRVVRIPRINNPYQRIFLKSDEKKTQLPFVPEVSEWLITLPEAATAPATIVIETVGSPQLLTHPFIVQPLAEGDFVLPAHHAVVHGRLLRYEPQPHKNTVGYWADEEDWCQWQLNVTQPGTYEVHVLQGCGEGHGGSEVKISVGKSELTFIVEDTGHFQNFKERKIGALKLTKKGSQSLTVVPVTKANAAVMDVRQIRLIPSDR